MSASSSCRVGDRELAAWERVGRAVRVRMGERALAQADLVRRAGLSDATVRRLHDGTPGNYRRATLGKLALALGWTPGSLEAIFAGGEPRERGAPEHDAFARRLDAMEDRLLAVEQCLGGYRSS